MLLARIARFIQRHAMFHAGQAAGVAVSGGADSVCLLHVLLELGPRWDLRLRVLHLNHNLRGEESRADAGFVMALANRLGLPATVGEADFSAAPGNLEEAAREARLNFFRERMAAGEVDSVALGHTRSDQAETVLFRFLRGAGSAGLAGIRPVTADGIVRPLLAVDRAEVEGFLRERGIAWREDSSNADPRFARNRIRRQLLPQLIRDWNPALAETLAQTADWARAEEAWWDARGGSAGGHAAGAAGRRGVSGSRAAGGASAGGGTAAGAARHRNRQRRSARREFRAHRVDPGSGVGRARTWVRPRGGPGGAPFLRLAAVRRAPGGGWPVLSHASPRRTRGFANSRRGARNSPGTN